MKAQVVWQGAAHFRGETDSGHHISMDGAAEFGGQNLGPRPMEMLLLGMGGCTAFDVVLILKKFRQDIRHCHVQLTAERATEEPKVFTRIHAHFVLAGTDLDPKKIERAIDLSASKYCSASIMLGQMAEITHDFEIDNTLPDPANTGSG